MGRAHWPGERESQRPHLHTHGGPQIIILTYEYVTNTPSSSVFHFSASSRFSGFCVCVGMCIKHKMSNVKMPELCEQRVCRKVLSHRNPQTSYGRQRALFSVDTQVSPNLNLRLDNNNW